MCCGMKASNPMQRIESVPNKTAIPDKQKRSYKPDPADQPAEAENVPQPAGEVMPTDQPIEIVHEPAPSNTRRDRR